MIRRIMLLLAVSAVLVLALVVPAFGEANDNASCLGGTHSDQIIGKVGEEEKVDQSRLPGAAGDFHRAVTQTFPPGTNGDVASDFAKLGPEGQARDTDGSYLSPTELRCRSLPLPT